MTPVLPSRYEDLDPSYRGRLRPNPKLISLVQSARRSMMVSGGIRFLPIFGRSGSGKSSAARELETHLPQARVIQLSQAAITSEAALLEEVRDSWGLINHPEMIIAVVDQYEENVSDKTSVPTQFVERLTLIDQRQALKGIPTLFLWLTTSIAFRNDLAAATTRRERVLVASDFELPGPDRSEWPEIIEENFHFHNNGQPIADFGIIRSQIESVSASTDVATIGLAMEQVGELLASQIDALLDVSKYQVVMLWPVTDGLRITRVANFTNPRAGYKLDWNAFQRELNEEDRRSLPLSELNRARLYFDVRLVPISAADLKGLCRDLDNPSVTPASSYLEQFRKTHFYSIVTESWNPSTYSPLRERESKRNDEAKAWYNGGITLNPTKLHRRIAHCLTVLGAAAKHEQEVKTPHSRVRADILVNRPSSQQSTCIVELKAYKTDGTMPSTIKDAIRETLKRHAQLAGFLGKQ
ncbi:hypothetical protein [Micrococcus aloeverae]|uniref:hypothetical protein n=1 Tax=Micrococcus aloeverae TaxID=1391911 RepID=UPI0009EEE660|nr:hypothetical protein [Micrococcus aloeverae]